MLTSRPHYFAVSEHSWRVPGAGQPGGAVEERGATAHLPVTCRHLQSAGAQLGGGCHGAWLGGGYTTEEPDVFEVSAFFNNQNNRTVILGWRHWF